MLDQMIITAAGQSTKSFEMLEAISENVGNYNTNGYKAVRFEQYLRPDGESELVKRTDYSPASTYATRRELDVALNGPGFMQVTRPDGTTAYTRNGSLARNADGFIVTAHGDLVGTGIQLPATYAMIRINPSGTVQLLEKPGQPWKDLGSIPVVNFPNSEGLKTVGENLVVPTADSGTPVKLENPQLFQQGHLEESNVNIHYAMEDILRLNAGVISNIQVIKTLDGIYSQATSLTQ